MATVSIIVPVSRNDEPWLEQALSSIEAQDYAPMELIVEPDPEGTGAAATRNRGLARASGEYVAFCDADDYLEPGAISKLVAAIGGVDMVCGSFRKFGQFEEVVSHPAVVLGMGRLSRYVIGNLQNPRSNQMLSGCWAKLYKRSLVEHFAPLTTAEDMAFNFTYLTLCTRVRFIENIVYHNRKRSGSLTTTFDETNKNGLFDALKALKYVQEFLVSQGCRSYDIDNSKAYHAILYFKRICEHTGLPMNEVFRKLYQ